MKSPINPVRAANLYLARALFTSQVAIANRISPSDAGTNGRLTRQAGGMEPITDSDARQYEESLELPVGWFDRDNMRLLKMTNAEYSEVVATLRTVKN